MDKQVLLELGGRLRHARKHFKLTQIELAAKLGVSKSSIINYESGKRIPDALFLINFLEMFDIDAQWLLQGEEGMASREGGTSNTLALDKELAMLVNDCGNPWFRVSMLAEYQRLKAAFKPMMDEYKKNEEKERAQSKKETG